ncbi:MAG: hypothetical protein BGN97_08800 [Microbacterium sp. 69-10]|uniref:DUF2332 domain-containing protein n=1 Tax=Microbacterium sp. 69-10 TaxID=1895783 RepID=UPI0009637BFE|nr:DUF2332 domain-containing protein [Microbacterium sp. 69-10]OJU41740.1 MAG: hypothetical protein BGN97_08800 [Microbacterium sp. 69-10]
MTDAVRERYDRFAREEAPGRSAVYAEWAAGVAADAEMQTVLSGIPEQHRQPPLVFAVTRLLGAPVAGYAEWRDFVLAHAGEVVSECARRTVQANEPLRLGALLPALSAVDGPIALLELGAAAGLCLFPDRYSYRLLGEDGIERARLDPASGPSSAVLTSVVRGALPPLRMPEVVWRAGIDLSPIDVRDAVDRAWLETLVWPGEDERAERIAAAADIVAADPPLLIAGDAAQRLGELVASAPRQATLVITTPGVLVYLPREARQALISGIRSSGARWVTIDPVRLHEGWSAADGAFAVGLDGDQVAEADPLGRWWEWRAGVGPDRA